MSLHVQGGGRARRRAVRLDTLAASALAIAAVLAVTDARAQGTTLPTVPVDPQAQPKQAPAAKQAAPQQTAQPKAKAQPQPKQATAPAPQTPPAPAASTEVQPIGSTGPLAGTSLGNAGADVASLGQNGKSLTVPTTSQAKALIERTPGGVALVPGTAYQDTQATTVKDVLDYVPGVFVQPKWGEDSRLSIRGSGLSRNFHLRSLQLYLDGIPINTADGYGDFQEIDPTAYKYVEVYKGGNALRFGGNSLGGAINFVTATGRDASIAQGRLDFGSFGFHRLQASSGAAAGAFDGFITTSWQEQDGFRDHSGGESFRGSANVGVRVSPDLETRFYVNGNHVEQRIPGGVTRDVALTSPTTAAAGNVRDDWQRNIDTVRVANRTVIRFAPTTMLEVGVFGVDRHLMHPIFEWLDYKYTDYGAFGRIVDERTLGGFKNRLVVGTTLHNGDVEAEQYVNSGGRKGALTFKSHDTSGNLSAYGENQFFVLPGVALVAGTQFLHATRDREDQFLSNGDQSGKTEFNLWSPKGGVLWDVTRNSQVYANVSRSAEIPSYGEGVSAPAFLRLPSISFTEIDAQRATTFEIGTRGRDGDLGWELTLYRAEIEKELMCYYSAFGNCNVTNADRTIHQGVEAGVSAAVLKGLFATGSAPDKIWLNAAYTYNDFRYDNDATWGDNELPGAPRHFVRAELLYKHPSGFYFGPNVELAPQSYYVDSANTLKTAGYGLWGAKIGWNDGGRVSVYLEGRNLADEKYIASASIIDRANSTMALFEPGTGRAVYGGVQFKW